MPPHLITLDEVSAWLADSAVTIVLEHRTDAVAAALIEEHGVDISRCDPYAAWGQGFYASSYSEPQYGPSVLYVAMRLLRPLVLPDTVRGAETIDDLLYQTDTEDIRAAVIDAGYDGIVVHFAQDEFWAVAYYDEQVKVVLGDAP